jgi:hypothetical protein
MPLLRAPAPRTPNAAAANQQPIFTQFTKDRASPDLPDVKLKRKAACAWDAIPAPLANVTSPSSGVKRQ